MLIPSIIIPRQTKIVKHFKNVIISRLDNNNKTPVKSIYIPHILLLWNNKLPNAGNIIKNVHHPGNSKLYLGSTISKTSVVIA
jgi:hypothetical protein